MPGIKDILGDVASTLIGQKYRDKIRTEAHTFAAFEPIAREYLTSPNPSMSPEAGEHAIEQVVSILGPKQKQAYQQFADRMKQNKAWDEAYRKGHQAAGGVQPLPGAASPTPAPAPQAAAPAAPVTAALPMIRPIIPGMEPTPGPMSASMPASTGVPTPQSSGPTISQIPAMPSGGGFRRSPEEMGQMAGVQAGAKNLAELPAILSRGKQEMEALTAAGYPPSPWVAPSIMVGRNLPGMPTGMLRPATTPNVLGSSLPAGTKDLAGNSVKPDKPYIVQRSPMTGQITSVAEQSYANRLAYDADGNMIYVDPRAPVGTETGAESTAFTRPRAVLPRQSTDAQGNVWQWNIKPLTGETSAPTNIGKLGKPTPPPMPGITLTPEAIQYWGQAAAQGIPLPSMGMGASGAQARAAIINSAAQSGAESGVSLPEARAARTADQISLVNTTRMRDAVIAFENTAKSNLDLFLGRAKSVVDSGVPWANQPLRSVNRNLLGDKDVAAFDAARQVALTEIAKVVNNPSLSSVLSDTARREVLTLVPENATLKQIVEVSNVLKQDMANRRKALDQQVREIRGRMALSGRKPQAAAEIPAVPGARPPLASFEKK
jgi:hypothetical protein